MRKLQELPVLPVPSVQPVHLQKLVLDLADQEMAVTFISSEIEEMLRTCSRMGVLRDGKKVGEISGEQLTQEGIMKAIAGGGDNE